MLDWLYRWLYRNKIKFILTSIKRHGMESTIVNNKDDLLQVVHLNHSISMLYNIYINMISYHDVLLILHDISYNELDLLTFDDIDSLKSEVMLLSSAASKMHWMYIDTMTNLMIMSFVSATKHKKLTPINPYTNVSITMNDYARYLYMIRGVNKQQYNFIPISTGNELIVIYYGINSCNLTLKLGIYTVDTVYSYVLLLSNMYGFIDDGNGGIMHCDVYNISNISMCFNNLDTLAYVPTIFEQDQRNKYMYKHILNNL